MLASCGHFFARHSPTYAPRHTNTTQKTQQKKTFRFNRRSFSEATGGLEPPNKSFADSPLTNLGTSPLLRV